MASCIISILFVPSRSEQPAPLRDLVVQRAIFQWRAFGKKTSFFYRTAGLKNWNCAFGKNLISTTDLVVKNEFLPSKFPLMVI